jgi:hypothetical protein
MNEDDSPRVPQPVVIIAGLVVLLLLGWHWLVPSFVHTGPGDRRIGAIANNLRILEGAKEQWALEHHATNGTLLTADDLAPYLRNGELPNPVAEETYTLGPVGELITAKLTRKVSWFEAGQMLTITNF